MTTTIADALAWARRRLESGGVETPPSEARLLLAHVLAVTTARIVGWPERVVSGEALRRFEALVERRASREPLAYLTGMKEFWGLEFRVDPSTLIPRPDTETLVDTALAWSRENGPPARVLDIGTGSGCLLVSLLREWPDSRGVGVDPSVAALAVAAANAECLGVGDRATWRAALPLPEAEMFDVVVANLPYIPTAEIAMLAPDVRDHEPRTALDGGPDGLAIIRAVAVELPRLMRPGALAAFEVGIGQATELQSFLAAFPTLDRVGMRTDLAGVERVVHARRRRD